MASVAAGGPSDSEGAGKKAKRSEGSEDAKQGGFQYMFDIISTEVLKFLDDNTDPKTVAALQTLGKRYEGCLGETLAVAKKVHEVIERYRVMYNLEFTCPLIEAASSGKIEDVKILLSQTGIDVNEQDDEGNSALLEASKEDHADIVNLLLKQPCIDINQENNVGVTPLHMAASSWSSHEIVGLLLSFPNIQVNRQDELGRAPLHKAANYACNEVIKILLNHPAIQINLESNRGRTPLALAIRNEHDSTAELLRAKGGTVNDDMASDWSSDLDVDESEYSDDVFPPPGYWRSRGISSSEEEENYVDPFYDTD